MDLKSFADDDFDPKKWINNAWSTSANQEKEVFVANAVSRLQLYMKQLTNSLDETTTQIVTSIPRVLQEASCLQVEGGVLQQQLQALEEKVSAVEEETGHSIQSLRRIDRLKASLENAASTLREADKWAALATTIEETLERGVPTQREKLIELTQQVAAMTSSLEVLTEAPDYEEKRLQLDTIYNRIEAAVSAPLMDAMTNMDAARTTLYVDLFASMSRASPLVQCWRRVVCSQALAWRWDRNNALTDALQQRLNWLSDVLRSESPLLEVMKLYTDLLLSLEPSPSKLVTAKLKQCATPQEAIEYLTDVRAELDSMADTFRKLLEEPRYQKENIPPKAIKELGRAIYAPIRDCLPKYVDLQKCVFNEFVEKSDLNQDDLLEKSRAIQNVLERSENIVKSAYATAKKIAGGAIYPHFVIALDSLYSSIHTVVSFHTRGIERQFQASGDGALASCFAAAIVLANGLKNIYVPAREDIAQETDILSSESLLSDERDRNRGTPTLSSVASLRRERDALNNLADDVLAHAVKIQLDKIPSLCVWSDNDILSTELPDYALSPQEYITEIGQYLMTLPQHLEMHVSDKQAHLQYLNQVCNKTCDMYAERILSIRNMDELGTRRCRTDIAYLASVVEDLGSSITPALRNLEKSLRHAAVE